VLLLNNDATLDPDYTARLAARLVLDERLAAAQGLVLTADGARVDTAGIAWTDRGEAVPALAGSLPSAAPLEPFEVSGVSATAALYRREALASVGAPGQVFDDSYFAYYEDADLSLRLARAGWRFACDPAARARHQGGATGSRMPFRRALWTARNRWRTLFRNVEPRRIRASLGRLLRATWPTPEASAGADRCCRCSSGRGSRSRRCDIARNPGSSPEWPGPAVSRAKP
jgi:GT2 family glycosyltransferase